MPEAPGSARDARAATPEQLDARYETAARHAANAVARAAPPRHAARLIAAARNAPTAPARVLWLQRAASDWAQPLQAHAACRVGCSHCCHIAVALTDVEARLVGRAIGREPAVVAEAPLTPEAAERMRLPGAPEDRNGYLSPCTFLVEGECSIYEHRPLACRTQLNLDSDDFLCALREDGVPVSVPYADATALKAAYVLAQPAAKWADIRAFFPRSATSS